MNTAEELEQKTQEAIQARNELKIVTAEARQSIKDAKDEIRQARAEKEELADGLLGIVQSVVEQEVSRITRLIQEEHAKALRKALHAVEEALRGIPG